MARSGMVTRRWTAEEDALLKRLMDEGETRPLIAARLKRTMAAVDTRVSFLRAQAAFRADKPKTQP